MRIRSTTVASVLVLASVTAVMISSVSSGWAGPGEQWSGRSAPSSATVAAPPTGVTALAGDRQVMVWWEEPVGDVGEYVVERSVDGGAWTMVSPGTGTSRPWYFDTEVANGVSVRYRVAAVTPAGTGDVSTASTAVTTRARAFPEGRSANGRYLVDGTGAPWFGVGDTAWSASAQLDADDARFYLDGIASRAMNLVLISAPEPFYTTQTPTEMNVEGELPFVGTPFASALNERYWELVDFFVEYASASGVFVVVTPAYLGFFPGDGWQSEVDAATTSQLAAYGQALELRYGARDNVGWLMGHDLQNMSASLRGKLKTIADQLSGPLFPGSHHESGATKLQVEEWVPPFTRTDFLSDGVYSYSVNPVTENHDGWKLTPVLPTAFFEGFYEQEQGNRVDRRYQSWGSFVGGAAWVLFGNNPRWNFEGRPIFGYSGTWQSSLDSAGTIDHERFSRFVSALPFDWSTTAPDLDGTVLVGGEDSGSSRAGVRYSDRGGVVYMPSSRTITLDLTAFSGGGSEVTISRVDPSDGATVEVGNYGTDEAAFQLPSAGANASGATDWAYVIEATGSACQDCSQAAWPDFDGDGLADRGVYRPESGGWYIDGQATEFLGLPGDVPVPGDYDGDGTTERAVFRDGSWFVDGRPTVYFGLAGDVPVPGDFDGDGVWEPAVFRDGVWLVQGQPPAYFGSPGDVPVPADYDGDGSTDIAIYRSSVGGWYVQGQVPQFFGLSSDVPVPGDYDGDGTADFGVYRPEAGGWYVQGQSTQYLGLNSDVPVPTDYDGDGAVNRAVYRPEVGGWYVDGASPVFSGLGTDVPLALPAAIYWADGIGPGPSGRL